MLLVIHTEADVLADDGTDGMCHVEHGSGIAAETARRLGCDADTIVATHQPDGTFRLGRRSRRVPPAMRRALKMRDQTCVFPGCEAVTRTDAHHVRFWTRGGPTVLANLALLCKFHHHRVHEGGYTMRPSAPGSGGRKRWEFLRPDGTPIPSVCAPPPRRDGLPAACNDIEPDACTPDWDGSGVNQAWVVEGLLQAEGLLNDTPSRSCAADERADADDLVATRGEWSIRSNGNDGAYCDDDATEDAGRSPVCGWLPPEADGTDDAPKGPEWTGESGLVAPSPGSDAAWPDPWPSPWTSAWTHPWPEHRDSGSA